MKNTVITHTIDDFQIVAGFGKAVINGPATKTAVRKTLEASIEYQNYQTARADAATAIQNARNVVKAKRDQLLADYTSTEADKLLKETEAYFNYKQIKDTAISGSDEDIAKISKAYNALQIAKNQLIHAGGATINATLQQTTEYADYLNTNKTEQEKVREKQTAMLAKNRELTLKNAVYFTPKQSEEIIEEAEAIELRDKLTALPANKKLLRNGTEIDDLRNAEYYMQNENGVWNKGVIEKLGETIPAGGILKTDLTIEQQTEISRQAEESRIDALTDSERQTGFKSRADSIALAQVRNKEILILTGTDEETAIGTVTDALNEAIRELWDLYGYVRLGRRYCINWAGDDIWDQYGFEET